MSKPKISVITTTWNRAKYLPRVHAGLMSQGYMDFEWIVANDGSTDDTSELINKIVVDTPFDVILITASAHVGKARMDNEAIAAARGEFIVWCDSDDYFLSNALEVLIATWETIPEAEREQFIGITALCESTEQILNEEISKMKTFDSKLGDLEYLHYMTEDGAFFLQAKILKQHHFPEVDLVVPESVVWSALGDWKVRVLTEVIQKKEYKSENSISFTNSMKYNRGRAYASAIAIRNHLLRKRRPSLIVWRTINYVRYCIHGDIKIHTIFELWQNNTSRSLLVLCAMPALLLAIKDRWQGKVVKSHFEFEFSADRAVIETYKFNGVASINPIGSPSALTGVQ